MVGTNDNFTKFQKLKTQNHEGNFEESNEFVYCEEIMLRPDRAGVCTYEFPVKMT